jgi:hypothetical protein
MTEARRPARRWVAKVGGRGSRCWEWVTRQAGLRTVEVEPMDASPEPMYAIHGAATPIDPDGEWLCVTFQRLGSDSSTDDVVRVRLSREDYAAAIEGRPIEWRQVGGRNWSERDVRRNPPCT